MEKFEEIFERTAKADYMKKSEDLNLFELHNCIGKTVMYLCCDDISQSRVIHEKERRAYYFSAEFLVGRAIFNNLLSLDLLDKVKKLLKKRHIDIDAFEQLEDPALGNGGLGRLAACFLDSAASCNLPLDGYGIRYKYGLFKQKCENGFQIEKEDAWSSFGDPWSIRREYDSVTVEFEDSKVKAVPYDMPVFGFKTRHTANIRLWQGESLNEFSLESFNEGDYQKAFEDKVGAETITSVLYPNDNTENGKVLRLKQQYFFSSASLQDIIRSYKKIYGENFDSFCEKVSISLNDTHPVIAIPIFISLLKDEGIDFDKALSMAKKVFNYTNHTVMAEALEKWDKKIINKVSKKIWDIISLISAQFEKERCNLENDTEKCKIIENDTVNMAYLACYVCENINGVAEIHTEIIKNDVLNCFYKLYPGKFKSITNGITQRRWLLLCNNELSSLITRLLKSDKWITDLTALNELKKYADDREILEEFLSIKERNKEFLSLYTERKDDFSFDKSFIVDVQIKRLHEYKRQLLNILSILELYFEIKEGSLKSFYPTVFIFGAKAAPGYKRAKGIIKLINEVSRLISEDEQVSKVINVKFITNYNVSYAEKIIPAANVSEQISTCGTEASGTGNMKLMLNGAVTIGTYDGANVEIVKEAGGENNYIFGNTVEDLKKIKDTYDPVSLYENDKRIKRCLNALVDGTLNDEGTGYFKELYDSLLKGASWHKADNYFLLSDFSAYHEARLKVNEDYKDSLSFAKKCWLNMCSAGKFSSDRAVMEYAEKIWKIKSIKPFAQGKTNFV